MPFTWRSAPARRASAPNIRISTCAQSATEKACAICTNPASPIRARNHEFFPLFSKSPKFDAFKHLGREATAARFACSLMRADDRAQHLKESQYLEESESTMPANGLGVRGPFFGRAKEFSAAAARSRS